MQTHKKPVITYILENIPMHSRDITQVTMAHFGMTRTNVHRYIQQLIEQGKIIKTGITRDVEYFLTQTLDKTIHFDLKDISNETAIYIEYFEQAFLHLPKNVLSIIEYGFSEMLNNAMDHSQGSRVEISTNFVDKSVRLVLQDDGIGAFTNIQNHFQLEDMRESILQLSIGKLTTKPQNHTGEGVFFTSRSFDVFKLSANGFCYIRDNLCDDWAFKKDKTQPGTRIEMHIRDDATTDIVSIFKAYQDDDSLAFDKTDILVELSKFGRENLISRSQAKRIIHHLDKFQRATLDFKNIDMVGQGFADEIFRVFAKSHPDIQIDTVNTNQDIDFMISRAKMWRNQ